ncbi:MAG: AarF/UbiB family protein [Patescibacteria group bacterium]
MSRTTEQSIRDEIVFARLRQAATSSEVQPNFQGYFHDAGGVEVALPYVEPGSCLEERHINNESTFQKFGGQLMRRLDFALAHLPPSPEVEKIRSGLAATDALGRERVLRDLQTFIDQNPTVAQQDSFFYLIKELPSGFGYFSARLGQAVSDKELRSAKKLGITLAPKENLEDKKNYAQPPAEDLVVQKMAMHLALGSLPPQSYFESEYPAFVDSEKEPAPDVAKMIALFKAAEKKYAPAWRENNSELYRAIGGKLSVLEWEEDNHLWPAGEDQAIFAEFKGLSQILKRVSLGERNRLSWTFLLKKLEEEEGLLQDQFIKLPYDSNYSSHDFFTVANVQDYIDHPEFADTLKMIGEKLAPFYAWDKKMDSLPLPEQHAAIARAALVEYIEAGNKVPADSELEDVFMLGIRKVEWQKVKKFKELLVKTFERSDLFQKAQEFTAGPFRDFLLYHCWQKEPVQSSEVAAKHLDLMRREIPDGAQANRSADIVNRYVRDHYADGTQNEERLVYKAYLKFTTNQEISDEDLAKVSKEEMEAAKRTPRYVSFKETNYDYRLQEAHQERKQTARESWQQQQFPPLRHLYLFSDAVRREDKKEAFTEKSYSTHLVTEIANRELAMIKDKIDKQEDIAVDLEKVHEWISKYLPESCLLKDFYLENILNLQLWHKLTSDPKLRGELTKRGIKLEITDVDLADHLAGGKDEGILKDAYFHTYSVFRVQGLATNIDLFSFEEKNELATLTRGFSQKMAPGPAEIYERICIELEDEKIRADYEGHYRDCLPRGRQATAAEEREARNKAFEFVLGYILKRFTPASYNRDELLERFALDYAMTSDQVRRVEEETYLYLVRQPEKQKAKDAKTIFSPAEAVKNYLALFSNRDSRLKVMNWIFGGEIPDDRYLEGREFNLNADEERELFWLMSRVERKAVVYNAMLGKEGLFQVPPADEWDGLRHDNRAGIDQFKEFLANFYEHNFKSVIAEDVDGQDMEPVLRTIFFEVFKNYTAPRRVELFLALVEKMRELRFSKDKKLTAPMAIRIFLEQVGVVGVKAGQVISEQKEMVSDSIKSELSSLKDKANPFSKFGVFAYLRAAGLLEGEAGSAPFQIAAVGECLGSASIKQAHLAWTTEKKAVVVKVPRPTIDKNYEEDIRVLEKVFAALRQQGKDIPEYLIGEIVNACKSEFDFAQEGGAQKDLDQNLYKRKAMVALDREGSPSEAVRLDVPDLVYLLRKGESRIENLQLMVDEFFPGLSLQDVENYQQYRRQTKLTDKERSEKEKIERRLERVYHEYAPFVRDDFNSLSTEGFRAQIALDLIEQIIGDGVFHADLHAGNIMIDLNPKERKAGLIDLGSFGRSIEKNQQGEVVDHRGNFKEFLQNLLFMKLGGGDTVRLGQIISQYVKLDGASPDSWAQLVGKLDQQNSAIGDFFKELLKEVLAKKADTHPQFRLLLKSLASAGGHFDALSNYLARAYAEAIGKGQSDGRPVGQVLSEYPGMAKLWPLIEGNQQLRSNLGI